MTDYFKRSSADLTIHWDYLTEVWWCAGEKKTIRNIHTQKKGGTQSIKFVYIQQEISKKLLPSMMFGNIIWKKYKVGLATLSWLTDIPIINRSL